MGLINRPLIFTGIDIITADEININFSTLYDAFNGNIDDSNIKANADIDASKLLDGSITGAKIANNAIGDAHLDYTSIEIVRAGPTFGPGPNGVRAASGRKASAFSAGTVVQFNVIFATDSDGGDPQFSAPPKIVATVEHTTGTALSLACRITEYKASGFTVEIRSSGTTSEAVAIHWIAIGGV